MTITLAGCQHNDPAIRAALLARHTSRSNTVITKLRAARSKRRDALAALTPPSYQTPAQALQDRVLGRLSARYRQEITRRGGETTIEGQHQTVHVDVADRDLRTGLVLMRAEGWRKYGQQGNRHVAIAYLCGMDDGYPWAARVAGNITNVRAALDSITPQVVKDAATAGKKVKRQGDVYAVETTERYDGRGLELLPASHVWNPKTRRMVHRPDDNRRHRSLHVPWPARWVRQTTFGMGRSTGRGPGD